MVTTLQSCEKGTGQNEEWAFAVHRQKIIEHASRLTIEPLTVYLTISRIESFFNGYLLLIYI